MNPNLEYTILIILVINALFTGGLMVYITALVNKGHIVFPLKNPFAKYKTLYGYLDKMESDVGYWRIMLNRNGKIYYFIDATDTSVRILSADDPDLKVKTDGDKAVELIWRKDSAEIITWEEFLARFPAYTNLGPKDHVEIPMTRETYQEFLEFIKLKEGLNNNVDNKEESLSDG